MTATNNPTPTELVQAGKEAFAAGKQAADCPYPIDDAGCGEQRHLWMRGHQLAKLRPRAA